jgi:hypothetical protein
VACASTALDKKLCDQIEVNRWGGSLSIKNYYQKDRKSAGNHLTLLLAGNIITTNVVYKVVYISQGNSHSPRAICAKDRC